MIADYNLECHYLTKHQEYKELKGSLYLKMLTFIKDYASSSLFSKDIKKEKYLCNIIQSWSVLVNCKENINLMTVIIKDS